MATKKQTTATTTAKKKKTARPETSAVSSASSSALSHLNLVLRHLRNQDRVACAAQHEQGKEEEEKPLQNGTTV